MGRNRIMKNNLIRLKLETSLEAIDMGNNQNEIAEWVENNDQWLDFVESINSLDLLVGENESTPTDQSWNECVQMVARATTAPSFFHPDDLVVEACEALNWHSVPCCGGLSLQFNPAAGQ